MSVLNKSRHVFKTLDLRCSAILSPLTFSTNTSTPALPSKVKVVICGAGVMGNALAYNLTKLGLGSEVIVIEKGRIGGASRWHFSGIVDALRPTATETAMCQETIREWQQLTEQGHETGWRQCGSLWVARSPDRMLYYRRLHATAGLRKLDCLLLSPADVAKRCPQIHCDDILGGLWVPGDGVANPTMLTTTLSRLCREKGIIVAENCSVQRVLTHNGKVLGVETGDGHTIECDYFVNTAGLWARKLGKLSDPAVKVPLHPVDHYYLHTKPVEGLDPAMPIIHDPDGHVYIRENNGCILAGGFEPRAKPAFEEGHFPENKEQRPQSEDWDHFHTLLEQMLHRFPPLGKAILEKLCNGPECFSPDCKWIIGEAPELRHYLVVAGMMSVGVSAAGGIGRFMAHWIADGKPPSPLPHDIDLQRFLKLHNNHRFLRDRVQEVPRMVHEIAYPCHEFTEGRQLRMSPIFPKLRDNGAVFGQTMGYERPSYYETPQDEEEENLVQPFRISHGNTFMKPSWFDNVKQEYLACRERVGIADYSSYSKTDLLSHGSEVVDTLQYLCSNDVDIPVGGIIHTGMQNHFGGFENDCSLARISDNHYMIISPTVQQTRCNTWITKHLPKGGSVALQDVTSMYTAICIMGPQARNLLSDLTEADLSPKNFPFFTFKELDVGLVSNIRAMNLTHTGELGWVLYIPNQYALHVYNGLVEYGRRYDLMHVGHQAMRTLRIEKFYAFWGLDIDSSTTPLECGRAFRVKFEKEDFIGKEALIRQREEGVRRLYVQLILEDHDLDVDPWPCGGEPILRDGEPVGYTTSCAYGFTLSRHVCVGYVKRPDGGVVDSNYVLSGNYEINIGGNKHGAKVSLRSPNLPTRSPEPRLERYMATQEPLTYTTTTT